MKKLWLLNDLFISEDNRGKGYATLLINKAKTWAIESNACGLSLETEISNIMANKLYIKEGFTLLKDNNFYFWTNPSTK